MSFREVVRCAHQEWKTASAHIVEQRQKIKKTNSTLSHFVTFVDTEPLTPLRDEREHPLVGLSFAVKDNIAVEGFALHCGLKEPLLTPHSSAAAVSHFLQRGACLNGICTMDELALGATGERSHSGRIVNPCDASRIPGGSSSGCAGAVSSGTVDFALGTDSGGSIRVPAACCRVVGLKLKSDALAREGAFLLNSTIDCFGLLTPSLHDMSFLLESSLHTNPGTDAPDTISLLIPAPEDIRECHPSIQSDFISLMKRLRRFFDSKDSLEPLQFEKTFEVRKDIVAKELEILLNELSISHDLLPPSAKALLLKSSQSSSNKNPIEELSEQECVVRLRSALTYNTFLLTPALPTPVPLWSELSSPRLLSYPPLNHFLVAANLADLPALTFEPKCPDSLPLQLVSPPGATLGSLLSVALKISNSLETYSFSGLR